MNVVICSDLHIDKNTKGRRKDHEFVRVQDGIDSLYDMTEYCREHDVEEFVVTGDTFDSYYVHSHYRDVFYNWLESLTEQNIKVTLLLGNHDIPANKTAKHSMFDLATLKPANIRVIEEPELLSFGDYDLACIPWNENDIIPKFDLTRTTIGVAHCSTFRDKPAWEDSGQDYQIPLEYFKQFDYTVLGHIHPYDVLCHEPLIMYAGSLQHSHFGGTPKMGFVHITDDGWEHIKYNLRPREVLHELPERIDEETIYRFEYTDDDFTPAQIDRAFMGCFSLDVKHNITRTERSTRFTGNMRDMTPDEIMQEYLTINGEDYDDIGELWLEILNE